MISGRQPLHSAVRQALMACNALPPVDPQSATPVRHITFEKHLDNLLRHILRMRQGDRPITEAEDDRAVDRPIYAASWGTSSDDRQYFSNHSSSVSSLSLIA